MSATPARLAVIAVLLPALCAAACRSRDAATVTTDANGGSTVSVGGNTVTTDATVGAVKAVGSKNTVRYAAGVGGREPTVSNVGSDNTIARGGQ